MNLKKNPRLLSAAFKTSLQEELFDHQNCSAVADEEHDGTGEVMQGVRAPRFCQANVHDTSPHEWRFKSDIRITLMSSHPSKGCSDNVFVTEVYAEKSEFGGKNRSELLEAL